jgi:NADP-dependent 3-hydroxy acid dehydrogenase YdfG
MKNVFDLVRKGTVKVVTPLNVIDYTDLEHVFRTMHEGNTVGKTVFRVTNESMVQALPAERNVLQLDPMGTYILVGGLGGLGRGIAIYLAENGAKNIAFISRSADSNAASQETLERLNAKGVRYTRHSCDVADAVKLELVIDEIKVSMPTIKGVIQAAMVLKDSIFENMNYESWITATRPKIQGSWNLHTFMPKELDFFIMLSSATGIIGNRGQANYCAGNTFQDALAHYRRSRGLPGTALDLGAIRGIGWVAENNDSEVLKAMDRILVDSEDLYAVLKSAMTGFSDGQHRLPTQVVMAAGTGVRNIPSFPRPFFPSLNRMTQTGTDTLPIGR